MLQVGRRRGDRSDRRGIERAAHEGQSEDARDSAADLESPRVDVLVRHTVTVEMQDRAECRGGERRPNQGTAQSARGNVERDDQ